MVVQSRAMHVALLSEWANLGESMRDLIANHIP